MTRCIMVRPYVNMANNDSSLHSPNFMELYVALRLKTHFCCCRVMELC